MTENLPPSTHDAPDTKAHALKQEPDGRKPFPESSTGNQPSPDPVFMEAEQRHHASSDSPASRVADERILGQRIPPVSSLQEPYAPPSPAPEQTRHEPSYSATTGSTYSTHPSSTSPPAPAHPNAVERGTRDILLASTGGLTLFLLSLVLFFASGAFWAVGSTAALALVFASILMVVAIVLSLWAAVRSIRSLFKGEEDKGHYVAAIIMAIITVPLSAIFSVIALVSALVLWFQSAF